ncbi:hypothetical protein GCM10025870_08100 [Agromyces marinus]|uniref:Methyltransferase domain-containing protein n=1 Tax=Agromyces marinus TaxID=1389020 RepID=A0ABM8GZ37_9MICO|nr:class I SAM-dependent methyltransferase [Agromyces marinus]BDZ53737.1 hypothetical protein GCM10025870_08100 [Agromyces marinus]
MFLGFHHLDVYHQPIAVRGRFERDRILPFGTVELHGREYPAVADPEGWLELCYGPGWRTPDPSFRFHTPSSTRRRFENWFGVYDLNRHFWEEAAKRPAARPAWRADVDALLAEGATTERVIDLGCGRGESAVRLAEAGRRVLAVDYALAAVDAVERRAHPRVRACRLNLADRRAVLGLAIDECSQDGPVDILLSDVLAYLTRGVRTNVFTLLRTVLGRGGVAIASVPVNPSIRYDHHRPDTWHLPISWMRSEAEPYGLGIGVLGHEYRQTSSGRRLIATVAIRRRVPAAADRAVPDPEEWNR